MIQPGINLCIRSKSPRESFIPKEGPGKKARRQLDSGQRATRAFTPVTKKAESKNSTTEKGP